MPDDERMHKIAPEALDTLTGLTPEREDDLEEEDDDNDGLHPKELFEHYAVKVDKGQKMLRIDRYLSDKMPNVSRNRIQQAADAGAIFVNGRPVKSNYKVKPLDEVSLRLERPPYEFEIIAEDIPLDIVYEDDALLVVNKSAGMVVHPGHGNYTGTMLNALAYYLKDDPRYDPDDPRLGLVHRIDKDTSGLLVVAKTPEVKADLSLQFFNKTTRRRYIALVWGRLKEDEGTVRSNIARHQKDRMQMANYPYNGDIGKPAVTHFKVIERLAYVTLVSCVLETGRTHQIRTHMMSIGHPLFNDERYGGNRILFGNHFSKYKQFVENNFAICPRQALHATSLGFYHPLLRKDMDFEVPLPQDMRELIDRWRDYTAQGDSEPQDL